jgi:drug/metabolite transporter (DMT)-like permease
MERRLGGMALVGGAAIVWSTGGLLARLVEDTDKWTTIFWRSGSAFAFLLVFMLITSGRGTPRLFRQMGVPGLAVALCFAAASIGLVVALSYTSVAQTLIIMSSTPLLAAIFGRVFLGEVIRPATYGAIAAVMAGIALMVSGSAESSSLLGDLFAGMIAVSYAGAIVISRRHHEIRMLPASCLGVGIAMLVAWPLAAPSSVTMHDLPVIFLFGAGQLGIGLALFVTGVRLIPASHSALLAMLEPILGPVWVWLALGERPALTVMIGGAVVLASILAKTLIDLREQAESPVAPG